MRIILPLIFLSFLLANCKLENSKLEKLLIQTSNKGYFTNVQFELESNALTFKLLDTFTRGEIVSVFEMNNELMINLFYKKLKDVKQYNFYYYRKATKKYVSFQYTKKDIDIIISKTSAREEIIELLFDRFTYNEISDIEYGYYQFKLYSPEYKPIKIYAMELIIRQASECYLTEDELSNYTFLINMFNEVGKVSYVERINDIIKEYCY